MCWTYLVDALKTAAQGFGPSTLSLSQPPQPPIEAVLATLLNDVHAILNDLVLVLYDYHVVDARDVQDGWPSCWSTSDAKALAQVILGSMRVMPWRRSQWRIGPSWSNPDDDV